MAKQFNNLMDKISPERRQRIEDRVQVLLLKIALQELRQMGNNKIANL